MTIPTEPPEGFLKYCVSCKFLSQRLIRSVGACKLTPAQFRAFCDHHRREFEGFTLYAPGDGFRLAWKEFCEIYSAEYVLRYIDELVCQEVHNA